MKKKFIILFVIALTILILIPIAIDWLIVGNSIPSNISNSDWVGFLGGYVGALIGAATSLGGIIITIRYTNQENKKDRELQVRPFCSLSYVPTQQLTYGEKNLGGYMISFEPPNNECNDGPCICGVLHIKNVGLGPAISFKIVVELLGVERNYHPVMFAETSQMLNKYATLLQPGEEGTFTIYINQNFDLIRKENVISYKEADGRTEYTITQEESEKYKSFRILVTVMYRDMYENEYSQKICFGTHNYFQCSADGGKYGSQMRVEYITEPKKVRLTFEK